MGATTKDSLRRTYFKVWAISSGLMVANIAANGSLGTWKVSESSSGQRAAPMKANLRAIRWLIRVSLTQKLAEEFLPHSGGLTNVSIKAISKMVFSRVSVASTVQMDRSWNADIGKMANLSPQWKNKNFSICLSCLRSTRKGRYVLKIKINNDH